MSDPILNYETPQPNQSTALRTGTWIYLLILGILYCLTSLCGGSLMLLGYYLAFAEGNAISFTGMAAPLIVCAIIFLVVIGSGITYVWTAFLIRRHSWIATRTALVVSIINAVLFILLLIVLIITAVMNGIRNAEDFVFGLLFCVAVAGANIVLARLLLRVLRNSRGQFSSQ